MQDRSEGTGAEPAEAVLDQDVPTAADSAGRPAMARRRALARLGLGAVSAYATPVVLRLRTADATVYPSNCEGPGDFPPGMTPECP